MREFTAELLAPAGTYETMKAAFCAGADAVYLGGQAFGARAYAGNLSQDELLDAIRYAHRRGRKLYLTVNTLVKESELEKDLYSYLLPYYEAGLDAVIVQDFGVLRFVREHFPDLHIHASTQMTASGPYSAAALQAAGARRIVLPRELSLPEIRAIRDAADLEIEAFVHGALCYCTSGQCLFSSLAGGRSGNRGRCAQPCRMAYSLYDGSKKLVDEKQGYLLSPKDLNSLALLPEAIKAGVYSLKIEGRMKKPEYTAGVVSIYRRYLDAFLEHPENPPKVLPKDQSDLFDLFNRKGFTEGYLKKHNGKDMITLTAPSVRRENTTLNETIREEYIRKESKENISGNVRICSGSPAIIALQHGETKVSVSTEVVTSAQKRPLSEEDIRRSMEKLGDSGWKFSSLTIETDGQSFFPVGKLNDLRRAGLAALEEETDRKFKRSNARPLTNEPAADTDAPANTLYAAQAETKEQLSCLLERPWIDILYLDIHLGTAKELVQAGRQVRLAGKKAGLVLPKVLRLREENHDMQTLLKELQPDVLLCSTTESLLFAHKTCPDAEIIADHSLYTWNRRAKQELSDWGATHFTVPVELNSRELSARDCTGDEIIAYGRLPMMVSAQCLNKTSTGCIHHTRDLILRDHLGNHFPVRNYCQECVNVIFNAMPMSLADSLPAVLKLCPGTIRLIFTIEHAKEVQDVLDLFEAAQHGRAPKNDGRFTRGHFARGVE